MRALIFSTVGLGLGVIFVGCTSILGDFGTGSTGPATDSGPTDSTTDGTGPDGTGSPDAHADGQASDGEAGAGSCTAPKTACTAGGVTTCNNLAVDTNNCGTCGHSCGVGGTCSGGFCQPTTVLTGSPLTAVGSLACDGTNVYWLNTVSNASLNAIYQVSLAGGGAIELSPSGGDTGGLVNVGVSGSTVAYTLDWGGEQVQLYTATVGAASSASELLVFDYGSEPWAMTNQGSTFYAGVNVSGGTYTIAQTTLASTAGTTLVSQATGQLGNTMAAAANAVFWTDLMANTVNFYTAANPNMMTGSVATSETGPQNLTTDGNYLYWVSGPALGASLRKAAAHATPQTVTTLASVNAKTWNDTATVVSDGTNVYWADIENGVTGIYTVPVAGGTPALLAPLSVAFPSNLAVCGSSLVWVEQDATSGVAATIRVALRP